MSGVTVHMIVADASRASAWYRDVLGAEERGRISLPDGRLIHVEVRVGASVFMLADEFPEHGALGPPAEVASALAFYVECDDAAATWARALAAGATEHRPLQDTTFGERDGQFVDPFGYRWGLSQHLRDLSAEEMSRAVAEMFGA
ncbi:MAG TPA: VOC family protein [Acidimicrobiales bacterium]|nr:VOC family protein [Acidimicrobiales bacterium]